MIGQLVPQHGLSRWVVKACVGVGCPAVKAEDVTGLLRFSPQLDAGGAEVVHGDVLVLEHQ